MVDTLHSKCSAHKACWFESRPQDMDEIEFDDYDSKNLSDADRTEIFHYLGDPEWLDIHG